MSLDFQLSGKRALITGAGQGVGAGIARMLAAAGAEVLVNDVVPDRAQSSVELLRADGRAAEPAVFDVTDFDGVKQAVGRLGPIDILINNAGNAGAEGFGGLAPFVETTPADWAKYLSVNLYGVMHCVHAALPTMIESRWGRIVTVISDAGRGGEAQMAAYSAAKAGAAGFSRSIAREVARYGITVNNLALGTMRTEATEGFWSDPAKSDQQKALVSGYLVRRPGRPDDVAWMVASLVSPRSAWVTGQTIPVNGGYSFTL